MGEKINNEDQNSRPLVLNLIVITGYAYLAYVMWPDIKDQVNIMRSSGVEAYAAVITSLFSIVMLVVIFCLFDVLKRIVK